MYNLYEDAPGTEAQVTVGVALGRIGPGPAVSPEANAFVTGAAGLTPGS